MRLSVSLPLSLCLWQLQVAVCLTMLCSGCVAKPHLLAAATPVGYATPASGVGWIPTVAAVAAPVATPAYYPAYAAYAYRPVYYGAYATYPYYTYLRR